MYSGFDSATLMVFAAMLSATTLIGLAALRSRQAERLRERLLRAKDIELAFQAQALNEHSLATVTDSEGNILEANDNFLTTFGYRRDQLVGKTDEVLFDQADLAICRDIREVTRKGKVWAGETVVLRADGTKALTQCTVVPLIDDMGRHVKSISLRVDITESRTTEAERLMAMAFDTMRDAVYVLDPETFCICYMNGFGMAEQGWHESDIGRKSVWDTKYNITREQIEEAHAEVQNKGKSSIILELGDAGETYEASIYLVSGMGVKSRILTIIRDISETTRLQRERMEFVSEVTHELRTPLTSIKGALGLLGSGAIGPLGEKAHSLVSMASRNAERMLGLIRDILEIERLGQTEMSIPVTALQAHDLIASSLEAHRGYAAELGVRFVNSGVPSDLYVLGNEDRMAQVLANLLSNAAKYGKRGGRVEVWGERVSGDRVAFYVRDHGPGIPDDLRDKLFERFSVSRQRETTGVDSTGLGLSITKALVEKMGGSIDFESQLGSGTTFRVQLPAASPEFARTLVTKTAA